MKRQIIITIILSTILALIIYKITNHEEINIVTLGDSLSIGMTAYHVTGYSFNDYLRDYYEENSILREYITEFAKEDETTKNLLTKIANNEKLESHNLTIQQAIGKANILTISIGMDELNNQKNLKSKHIEQYLKNMEKLITQIRNFNKKEIIVLGLYKTTNISEIQITKINQKLQEIAENNQAKFINIREVEKKKEFYFEPQKYELNYKGHRFISELILNNLSK